MAKTAKTQASQFAVEKNIPIPTRVKSADEFPIYDLEVGDSFFVPANGVDTRRIFARLSSRCQYHATKSGREFVLRTDRENNGVRVWRTA